MKKSSPPRPARQTPVLKLQEFAVKRPQLVATKKRRATKSRIATSQRLVKKHKSKKKMRSAVARQRLVATGKRFVHNASATGKRSATHVRRRGVYILPNLFTTAGLFAGFYAIIEGATGRFENAAIAILIAMVMDGLDGRIARMTGTSSDFGKEYDSLVDVVCFGLAPAMLMFEWALSGSGKGGWLSAFLYVASAALRLARFNTQQVAGKRFFHGLPCPAAAALVASFIWVCENHGIRGDQTQLMEWLSISLTLALSLSMVSGIRYRSFKDLDLKGRMPFLAAVSIVLIFALISFDPPHILFACSLLYFLSGPITHPFTVAKRLGGK